MGAEKQVIKKKKSCRREEKGGGESGQTRGDPREEERLRLRREKRHKEG